MSRRKQSQLSGQIIKQKRRRGVERRQNKTVFKAVVEWLIPEGELFTKDRFHGNIDWAPEQLAQQATIWAWQDNKNVTDAFAVTAEVCEDLRMENVAQTYTTFMNALDRYRPIFSLRLRQRFQMLAEEVGGRFWRDDDWVLMGFDGSRLSTPRTVSNEKAFCAPDYGNGKTAKYRKKKTKGMRRLKNEKNKAQPQVPQTWVTMVWHMSLRLPWTWRLGPSNSSERGHVIEINRLGGGIVLCWPKDQMNSGSPPLRLRLVHVKIGNTKMWMLTSVLDPQRLPIKKIITYYKMRWGVEVEYRGLKQTIDKRHLRCRNSDRVYVELDWSIRAMAMAELIALREQIPNDNDSPKEAVPAYNTKDRSLANTMRTLRKCIRNLDKYADPSDDILHQRSPALVQKYNNRAGTKSRYRPQNPDKKPLGEPTVKKLNREQREKLRHITEEIAA